MLFLPLRVLIPGLFLIELELGLCLRKATKSRGQANDEVKPRGAVSGQSHREKRRAKLATAANKLPAKGLR